MKVSGYPTRWLAVLSAAALFFVGCQADDEGPAPAASPATDEAAHPPGSVVTNSSCRNEARVAGDISKRLPPTLTDDFNGDGVDERVSIHLDPKEPSECRAFTVVEKEGVIYSGVIEPVQEADPLVFGRIIGAAPVDGSAGLDLIVQVGAGASTQFAAVYRWKKAGFVPVKVEGGDGVFAFGGSASHVDAVDCTNEGLIVATSAIRARDVFRVERRFYDRLAGKLVLRRGATEVKRIGPDRLGTLPEFLSGPFAGCP